MNKTIVIGLTAVAIAVAAYVVLFNNNQAQAPIVDAECPRGYELVGEGCMTHDDACALAGDQYSYDEATEECLVR